MTSPETKEKEKQPRKENLPHPDSYYAMRIVAPVANPQTAPHLLRFAASLAHPTKGKVFAVFINNPDSPYQDAAEKIERICTNLKKDELPIEYVAITSQAVARGIMDVARERNADLLILGFRAPKDGKVVLGDVTESIARVATQDLIVHRSTSDSIERIVVPATTLGGTRLAMIHALHLAQVYDKPVVALFVNDHSSLHYQNPEETDPFWLQRSRIYDAIHSLPGTQAVKTEVVDATDLVTGVQGFTDEHDLIVYTVSNRQTDGLEKWVFGPTAQRLLRLTPGSLALVKRPAESPSLLQRLADRVERLRPMLTIEERTGVMQEANNLARANTNFMVMIILASILASIGLVQNSAAVIIGAMLVAPLMSPLMGFGAGLALGNIDTMRRSAITVAYGVLTVVLVSSLIGVLFRLPEPTSEMLGRGRPNFLDLMVALASGAAGAFALARRDVPAALAGVAIAAALVPPICTTGLALAIGDTNLMLGAGALSIVNIIGISITAAGVFAAMGIHQEGNVSVNRRMAISFATLLILAIPLVILLRSNYIYLNTANTVEEVIEAELTDTDVVDVEIDGLTDMAIVATIRTPHDISNDEMQAIETKLEDDLNRNIDLSIVAMRVVRVESETN